MAPGFAGHGCTVEPREARQSGADWPSIKNV
jgi:hypothetical protein